jgi:anti-sigma factor RsiW
MTERDQSFEPCDCGADVAAYALGALDVVEAEAFRRHLQLCAVCRDELAAFQEVVDVLPVGAPQYPAPSGLRRRVLNAVEAEPRPSLGGGDQRRARRPFMGLSLPRPALAGVATVVIALAVVGGIEIGSSGKTGAHVYAAHVVGPGSAEVTVNGASAKLVVHGFPPPPKGHVYEVWLERSSRLAPTDALFSVSTAGDGDVDVPGDLHGVSKILVTPEPDGGSPAPTHAPVISVQLS